MKKGLITRWKLRRLVKTVRLVLKEVSVSLFSLGFFSS